LPGKGFTPDQVVPLAFHVDYWDSLGWADRFAHPRFSDRQRAHADRNQARFVYTPQFLLNGTDYRLPSSTAGLSQLLKKHNAQPEAARLRLGQRSSPTGIELELEAQLLQPAAQRTAETFVVVTENNLRSEVLAGENRGKLMLHDFVVRELVGPLHFDDADRLLWDKTIALRPEWKRRDLALAAFVQDSRTGNVLQALQAPLCNLH
jgi:hypothetical protein